MKTEKHCCRSSPVPKQSFQAGAAGRGEPPQREMCGSRDGGGGQAAVSPPASVPRRISPVRSSHVPPSNRSLALRLPSAPPLLSASPSSLLLRPELQSSLSVRERGLSLSLSHSAWLVQRAVSSPTSPPVFD